MSDYEIEMYSSKENIENSQIKLGELSSVSTSTARMCGVPLNKDCPNSAQQGLFGIASETDCVSVKDYTELLYKYRDLIDDKEEDRPKEECTSIPTWVIAAGSFALGVYVGISPFLPMDF